MKIPKRQPVSTRQELVELIHQIRRDFKANGQEWENPDIASYLEAMAGWITDMDGYYANRGEPIPEQPTWGTFADILRAAIVYE